MKIRRFAEPLLFVLIAACLFPIINFNPANTAQLVLPMRIVIIAVAAGFCASFGRNAATLYPRMKRVYLPLFALGIAVVSLLLRFFLEFGEVSNVYNFTLSNILFHLLFITIATTGAAYFGKNRTDAQAE